MSQSTHIYNQTTLQESRLRGMIKFKLQCWRATTVRGKSKCQSQNITMDSLHSLPKGNLTSHNFSHSHECAQLQPFQNVSIYVQACECMCVLTCQVGSEHLTGFVIWVQSWVQLSLASHLHTNTHRESRVKGSYFKPLQAKNRHEWRWCTECIMHNKGTAIRNIFRNWLNGWVTR